MNKLRSLGIITLIFVLSFSGCSDEMEKITPDSVFFVTSINSSEFYYSETVYIKAADSLNIQPIFICDGKYFSDVSSFYLDGKRIDTAPAGSLFCYVCTVLPVLQSGGYDNFENAPRNQIMSYVEPISYQTQKPILFDGSFHFMDFMRQEPSGTYYIKASLQEEAQEIFSSAEKIKGKNGIIQIVRRNGDDYLEYLSELMGTPFIMFPKVMGDGTHQTDALIGSDCAEFSIYGRRRMGFQIPYCGPKKLYEYLDPIVDGRFFPELTDERFILYNGVGNRLAVDTNGITPGDVLHYGSQVAVFYKDCGIIGLLDGEDLVFQSYGDTPYYATLYENAQIFGAFEVYRWK